MPQFVFEIGFEEMPARFQPGLAVEFERLLGEAFGRSKLDFSGLVVGVTPRRLAAAVADLGGEQRREEEVVTGPPVRVAYAPDGSLTKAGSGFAKTQGVSESDLFAMTTEKGEYLAARKATGGAPALALLPGICAAALAALSFPKKMRWGCGEIAFGRPIRWILAVYGADAVEFEYAGVASGRLTHGHRVMGPGPFPVARADDYAELIRDKGKVILDPAGRRALIAERAAALAREVGGVFVMGESLLQEVVGLVEYPVAARGRFDDKFLELPREVLLTSMEKHQKCIGVPAADNKLLPYFIATLGLMPTDLGVVRRGWERVLRARLEDAMFFWRADMAADLDGWLAKLDQVVFLGPLGSVGDKTKRVSALCGWLADTIDPGLAADLTRAGRICKADLVSQMVGEFAELQGVMGGIYALAKGESKTVSDAVAGHYLPLGPDSPLPETLAGALVSIADKIDTLVGCFGLDMIPTGAADPYALRRAALGVCRIVVERGLRPSLADLIDRAIAGYEGCAFKLSAKDVAAKLMDFFAARLKAYFAGRGYETLVVEAAASAGVDDVWSLASRLEALGAFAKMDDFGQAVLTFKRAANIIRKQAAGEDLSDACDPALLAEPAERALYAKLAQTGERFEELWKRDDYGALFALLRELRPQVDTFFDAVMVMDDDPCVRRNRLLLLSSLVERMSRLADFSALQV
ncbi:MAG: glycine--tRNA ligase subunit beta [Desulfovibrionaceae bacterium]|nr:glycine--tRNA ligase subunit beta [Desulfovibrionaceae bacterium]MBF0513609.1 glycine--tRNA ligase subunit beta [Desulfovibrionaceae bacterium]